MPRRDVNIQDRTKLLGMREVVVQGLPRESGWVRAALVEQPLIRKRGHPKRLSSRNLQ